MEKVMENNTEYFIGNNNMTTDDVAALLVKLYGKYINQCGDFGEEENDNFARAVAIAVRMLTD